MNEPTPRTKEMWRSPCGKVAISTDGVQWVVNELDVIKKGDNKGKECFASYRYHYRLEWAIECAARLLAMRNAKDLREYLEFHRATIKMLLSAAGGEG